MILQKDFDLTHLTTFHVPARTRWFAQYGSIDELLSILSDPRFSGMPRLHIGGGSNLLFTKPFEGIVLHSAMTRTARTELSETEAVLYAESGLEWDKFVRMSIEGGLYGLENLAYIPGETGASAVQNIGAYGIEAKDLILAVDTIDTFSGKSRRFNAGECAYAYRDSMFKHAKGRYIVTGVAYKLSKVKKFTLDYGPLKEMASIPDLTLEKVYDRIVEIRSSKLPDPAVIGSAGSFFKNPVVTEEMFKSLQCRYPQIPHYDAPGGMKIPAGWLIEHAGLKGYRIGGAEVYPKQCLVIANADNATAEDVVALYTHVRDTVRDTYGIFLEPEANII